MEKVPMGVIVVGYCYNVRAVGTWAVIIKVVLNSSLTLLDVFVVVRSIIILAKPDRPVVC